MGHGSERFNRFFFQLEHLQEFAKIHLANLVIWQLPKTYAKLKYRLSPFGLGKIKN
jgi:hypothetical protein